MQTLQADGMAAMPCHAYEELGESDSNEHSVHMALPKWLGQFKFCSMCNVLEETASH